MIIITTKDQSITERETALLVELLKEGREFSIMASTNTDKAEFDIYFLTSETE